ncbi:hypothetical protein ACIRBY_36535 [Streptomyces sp. NPDC096136]
MFLPNAIRFPALPARIPRGTTSSASSDAYDGNAKGERITGKRNIPVP